MDDGILRSIDFSKQSQSRIFLVGSFSGRPWNWQLDERSGNWRAIAHHFLDFAPFVAALFVPNGSWVEGKGSPNLVHLAHRHGDMDCGVPEDNGRDILEFVVDSHERFDPGGSFSSFASKNEGKI